MNYINIYKNLMQKALLRTNLSGYIEKHHILPRCIGGSNYENNLVKLTAREHFIAHKLLVRIYPENHSLSYALWGMCMKSKNTNGRYITSSRDYENIKNKMSLITKSRLKKHNHWVGRKHSKKSKEKMSESAKKRKISTEMEKQRRDGISNGHKNKPLTKEHIANISESKKGEKNPMYGKKWKLVDGKRTYY